ncbi:MAG: toxin-antitoxin system YwqK family antitoxin [Flavobacteriaceae bacterium]|nr:toxin-antitoxin system YwqK family antitoxin [Flavobacteriaceae bacterium]
MAFSQVTLNRFDSDGKRHGKWAKTFDNSEQLRYEGQFEHGKEVGEFKFYQMIGKVSKLAAVKEFNPDNNNAKVRFISLRGKTISEGMMNGKKYIGEWRYYHKNSDRLMTVEHYNEDGQLDGKRLVYYNNGQLAEELNFIKGKLEGTSNYYTMAGVLMKRYHYENNELHGLSEHFDEEGNLQIKGRYKRGKKDGVWTYYKNGEVWEEKDFSYVPKYRSKN